MAILIISKENPINVHRNTGTAFESAFSFVDEILRACGRDGNYPFPKTIRAW